MCVPTLRSQLSVITDVKRLIDYNRYWVFRRSCCRSETLLSRPASSGEGAYTYRLVQHDTSNVSFSKYSDLKIFQSSTKLPLAMARILLLLIATLATALAWQYESFHHTSQHAISSDITADLSTISQDLSALTATVNAYAGGMPDGLAVINTQRALIRDLELSTTKAQTMQDVDKQDARGLLESIRGLVLLIEETLDAIAKKEPELRGAGRVQQTVAHFETLQGMVEEYGGALVVHMPDWEERQGNDMLGWIREKFAQTIEQLQ
jgi:hypothetical protein